MSDIQKEIIENLKHNLQFTNNVKKELMKKNIELQKENLKQKKELYYLKKYDLKIFTDDIENEARKQVYTIVEQEQFKYCKIRIMPDVHAGTGCVIGFTADLGDKVIPNIVGVDIGCGLYCANLGKIDIDYEKLDKFINDNIPSGMNVNDNVIAEFDIKQLYCYDELKHYSWIEKSVDSLGGGNHFIEIDIDDEGNKYLVIHTGSRNLGSQVAELYQDLADKIINHGYIDYINKKQEVIKTYKELGKQKEIQSTLNELQKEFEKDKNIIPKDLAYLEGKERDKYLHDMKLCQEFAILNRKTIANTIAEYMGFSINDSFESVHNYISFEDNIVRKGAISAKKGEKLIIPINMKDGCILGYGKGNKDWNNSAPHGAGRIMSRKQAKERISMEDYKKSMQGIYSTSVSEGTIDEAPFVYKPMQEIIDNIQDTVEVQKIIKPIYNFKANI